jgi:hypothetical protein
LKKIYLLLIALIAGFGLAFLAAGVHSLFFVLLPVLAFICGYFSTWRRGLLCGFLLFSGYTFTISVIWWGIDSPNLLYPFPYIAAFIFGGFGILLISALAPLVKKGAKRFGSIVSFAILAVMVGWCSYSAVPHYSYYYQVAIQSPENVKNLELYLPLGTVSGEPYEELYSQENNLSTHLKGLTTEIFTQEIVATEQGQMLKLTIPNLKKDDVPDPRYTANIIWQTGAPGEILQLMPKSDIELIHTVIWQRRIGPVKSHESHVVERFNVPVKIVSDTPGPIKLTLWNRTDRSEAVNFTYSRSYPCTERISYEMQTGNEWVFIPVEATVVMSIRGISD